MDNVPFVEPSPEEIERVRKRVAAGVGGEPTGRSRRGLRPLGEAIESIKQRLIDKGAWHLDDSTDPVDPYSDTADGGPPCHLCHGARWLVKREEGQPPVTVMCPQCKAVLAQRRINRLTGELPERLRGWTYETFIQHATALGARSQANLAYELRDAWLPTGDSLFLFGAQPGKGKTGLAVAMAKLLIVDGNAVAFRVVPDLLDDIRRSYGSSDRYNTEGQSYMDVMVDADVLVMDDLGAERQTDWASETLYTLIGRRHSNNKRTIFTSNYGITELADRLGHPRTASRITEMCGEWIYEVDGVNLRTKPPAF